MRTISLAAGGTESTEAWKNEDRVSDIVTGSYLMLLLGLVVLFPFRFGDPAALLQRLGIVVAGFVITTEVSRRFLPGSLRAAARISIYASVLMYLFDEMQYFQQLLFDGWFDAGVLRVEAWLFGGNLVADLQPLMHPWLTEGLMFTYVIYMPLLPVLALVIYLAGGTSALSDYLLNISLIFLACFAGYVILPVASPMYYNPGDYTVPLDGGLWTWCGEWLRQNHHYPGGSVPSAHCAAATGMMVMLYRHFRKGFYVSLPIFIPLYAATVYGRYHYLTDAILGILTAIAIMRLAPALVVIFTGETPETAQTGPISRKSQVAGPYTILTNGRPASDSSGS